MLILKRKRTRQPQVAVGVDWDNQITRGLVNAVNFALGVPQQIAGAGLVGNGTTSAAVTAGGTAVTNNGEKVSSGTASNYFDLPVLTSAFTLLYVGGRFSTPAASNASVAVSTRQSSESAGLELDLGNGYADPNLLYFYPTVSATGAKVFVNGVPTVGTNPSNLTVINGVVYNIAASFESHAVGSGHTLLAKASGTGDFAWDTFCLLYAVWNRQLSDAEHASVSANPWQLFAPLSRRVWVPETAGGGSVASAAGVGAASGVGAATAASAASAAGAGAAAATGAARAASAASAAGIGAASATGAATAAAIASSAGTGAANAVGASIASGSAVGSAAGQAAATAAGAAIAAAMASSAGVGTASAVSPTTAAALTLYLDVLSGKVMLLRTIA